MVVVVVVGLTGKRFETLPPLRHAGATAAARNYVQSSRSGYSPPTPQLARGLGGRQYVGRRCVNLHVSPTVSRIGASMNYQARIVIERFICPFSVLDQLIFFFHFFGNGHM